jgi:hypothetical protein
MYEAAQLVHTLSELQLVHWVGQQILPFNMYEAAQLVHTLSELQLVHWLIVQR